MLSDIEEIWAAAQGSFLLLNFEMISGVKEKAD